MKVQWLHDFISVFYPEVCLGCTQPLVNQEKLICLNCLAELPKTNFHKQYNNPIFHLFTARIPFQKATAYLYFQKKGIVQSLIHNLKYNNFPEVGVRLGRMAGTDLIADDFPKGIDVILPVPLHPTKQSKRGYNQSESVANGLATIMGIPVITDKLVRVTRSSSQTRKSRFARWLNVEHVFEVNQPEDLTDRHVLLVDDVVTTGSTLEAAASRLLEIPALKISLFTLAYAP
ncbi:MAG: ComF family protein [Owenweeksia sp.]